MQSGALGTFLVSAVLWTVAWFFVAGYKQSMRLLQWPSTPGIIQSIDSVASAGRRGSGGGRTLKLSYTYVVNGAEYKGDQWRWKNNGVSQSDFQSLQATVTPGSSAPVYYNPQSPHESVLHRDMPSKPWVYSASAFCIGFPLLCWLMVLPKLRR